MDYLKKFSDIDPTSVQHVKCRRVGLEIEWFSIIHGRVVLCGTATYISKKNYRSNEDFHKYKTENPISERTLVILTNGTNYNTHFKNPDDFMSDKFNYGNPSLIIYASSFNNFKLRKSKTFYVKARNAMVLEKKIVVDNFTLECSCNFQD